MNCQQVQEQLLADPHCRDVQVQQHIQGCQPCAHFYQGLLRFNADLQQACNTDVPSGLASRIIVHQRLHARKYQHKRRLLAVAATLLVGISALLTSLFWSDLFNIQSPGLEQVVLKHVADESGHLQDHYNLSLNQLNSVLQRQGSKLNALPGRTINYAGACPIRKHHGVHMVIGSDKGPVTVLFMPGEYVEQRRQMQNKRFNGVIIPTTRGSVAIVAEDPEEIEQLEREIKANLIDLS